eukprot:1331770-Rhodomonas_salina.2
MACRSCPQHRTSRGKRVDRHMTGYGASHSGARRGVLDLHVGGDVGRVTCSAVDDVAQVLLVLGRTAGPGCYVSTGYSIREA